MLLILHKLLSKSIKPGVKNFVYLVFSCLKHQLMLNLQLNSPIPLLLFCYDLVHILLIFFALPLLGLRKSLLLLFDFDTEHPQLLLIINLFLLLLRLQVINGLLKLLYLRRFLTLLIFFFLFLLFIGFLLLPKFLLLPF